MCCLQAPCASGWHAPAPASVLVTRDCCLLASPAPVFCAPVLCSAGVARWEVRKRFSDFVQLNAAFKDKQKVGVGARPVALGVSLARLA